MHSRFIHLLNYDPNINNSNYFNGIVFYLIEIFNKTYNNKYNFKKLLEEINSNKNLKKEKLANLYNNLLYADFNDNKNISQIVCENIIKYSEDPYSIVTVMKNIVDNINGEKKNDNNNFNKYNNRNYNNSINNLKTVMEKLNNKIINEDDFLSKNSDKFILFKLLVEAEFFSDKFQFLYGTTYIKITKQRIDDILTKYATYKFTISEAFQLKEMNDLKEKIKFLYLNKDFEADLLYNTLIEKIKEAIETKKMIDSVQNYINNFFSKNEDSIKKINRLSKKISQIKIYELNNYSKEINEYQKLAKDAQKANECSKCEFFLNIF